MSKSINLPLPPRIEAIARLDDLEELEEAFYKENHYRPELVSHWDPKQEYAQEIQGWAVNRPPIRSIVQYTFSSYLNIDEAVRHRLGESANRGLVATISGTTSIATMMIYLSNIKVDHLHVLVPSYFAVEALAKTLSINTHFHKMKRAGGRYSIPSFSMPPGRSAVWITLPIYGASSYIAAIDVANFVDALPQDAIVVIDESLAFVDRPSVSKIKTMHRVVRISSPHKALCLNGEKVSIISCPDHLTDCLNEWSECLVGGIGASGLSALQFLATSGFEFAIAKARALLGTLATRLKKVVGERPTISLDEECDGHFRMLYWPNLSSAKMDQGLIRKVLFESGALPMPASRNRHPEENGFAFRVNLLRLDDAGLGGLRRLADALDAL